MISEIYIMLYIVAFIAFCKGIDDKNITYTGSSLVLFLVLWVQAVYIEVPWIAVTNATNYTVGNQQHLDMAISASCWLFIILDIVIMIYYYLLKKGENEGPAMP